MCAQLHTWTQSLARKKLLLDVGYMHNGPRISGCVKVRDPEGSQEGRPQLLWGADKNVVFRAPVCPRGKGSHRRLWLGQQHCPVPAGLQPCGAWSKWSLVLSPLTCVGHARRPALAAGLQGEGIGHAMPWLRVAPTGLREAAKPAEPSASEWPRGAGQGQGSTSSLGGMLRSQAPPLPVWDRQSPCSPTHPLPPAPLRRKQKESQSPGPQDRNNPEQTTESLSLAGTMPSRSGRGA